jgi:cobalamin biosynthesis protein CobT
MKIAAFTEKRPMPRHYIVKEYDERRGADDIIQDYGNIYGKLWQNADGESIMWAFKDLILRPEQRKILIVLSDGSPSSDRGGDCFTYTKDVIAMASKHVETYGIGIMDDSVQRLYPEYTVLNRAEELESCLLDLIKTKIFKM